MCDYKKAILASLIITSTAIVKNNHPHLALKGVISPVVASCTINIWNETNQEQGKNLQSACSVNTIIKQQLHSEFKK